MIALLRGMKAFRFVPAILLALGGLPASANDSTGFEGTTGIELSSTDAVRMETEDLYVSPSLIKVDYVFRNVTGRDVQSLVVFPFPDLDLSAGLTAPNWRFPADSPDFLDFKVWVDGRPVTPTLERRAFLHGRDVTAEVTKAGALDLAPWRQGAYAGQVAALAPAAVETLRRSGLLAEGEDPDTPQWTLRTRYFWPQSFPAGSEVHIHHSYRPFVGRALIGAVDDISGRKVVGRLVGATPHDTDRYCLDPATRRALESAEKRGALNGEAAEIDYILVTARNWRGPIGRFHLTIDKGAPENILSLCWNGLRKTGPTTFESTIPAFRPDRNLDLLIFPSRPKEP